jgi:hypothetical protein
VHGKADLPPLEACSVADYGNLFNPDSQERALNRSGGTRPATSTKTDGLAAQPETGRLRIINTPMGQERDR